MYVVGSMTPCRCLQLRLSGLIDRECVNLHNASIVFVGGAVAEVRVPLSG